MKLRCTLVALSLTFPLLAAASDRTERLAGEVGKLDCARLDTVMQTFLKENREHLASLPQLSPGARLRELESYRKALTRAEDASLRCAVSKAGMEAKLTSVGSNPNHLIGFYSRLNATIDYTLNSSSNDPYVFEQLTRSYDDLIAAYQKTR